MHIDRNEQDGKIVLNLVIEGSDCPPETHRGCGRTVEHAMFELVSYNPHIFQVSYDTKTGEAIVTATCNDDRCGNAPTKGRGKSEMEAAMAIYEQLHTATFPYRGAA